jgi:hypothetical protein
MHDVESQCFGRSSVTWRAFARRDRDPVARCADHEFPALQIVAASWSCRRKLQGEARITLCVCSRSFNGGPK